MFWDRLSELFVRHRRALTLFVVLMTVLALCGLVPPLGPLRFDDRPHLVFKTGGADYAALDQLKEDFGADDSDCYILVQATNQPHLFTPLAVEGLRHIVGRIKALEVSLRGRMVKAIEDRMLLFTVPLGPETELSAGRISDSLKKAFDEDGKPLPEEDVTVSVVETDREWRVDTKQRRYGVRKTAAGLEIVDLIDAVRSMAEVKIVRRRGSFGTSQRPLLPEKNPDQSAEEFKQICEKAKQEALDHPLVAGRLLSEDAKSTLVIARLSPKLEAVSQFGLAVDEFRELAKEVYDAYGLRLRTTGVPPIRVEIYRSIVSETVKFTLIAVVLASVMGFILFRRVSLVVLTCVGPWCGALWTLGFMGLIGEPLNIINVVLPTLVVVVGFTNAIHLVVDMRQSLAQGKSAMQAAAGAVRLIGGACGLAALTTAVGFSSLIVSESEIIQRFGLVCGGGALMSFLAVVATVPLLGSVLLRSEEGRKPEATSGGLIGRFVDKLVDRVLGRHLGVAVAGMLLTAALASTAILLKPDTMLTETIPRNREVAETLDAVDEIFGGAIVAIVHLEWNEQIQGGIADIVKALIDVEKVVGQHPELKYPLSTLNLLRSMPGGRKHPASQWNALGVYPEDVRRRFMNVGKRRAIVVSRIRNTGGASHEPVYQKIEAQLAKLEQQHPAFTMRLTGMPVVAARSISQMIWDLATSLSLAGVVIFGVITVTFRSPRLGAISIVPNVFPLVVTSAVLAFSGRPLQLATVIVFTICLGIAVDDTIHLINRFRREYLDSGDTDQALRRSGRAVGTALVTSTIVLLVGFGSMLFAEVPATLLFAWFTSIGIAAALIGDLVILPAMLAWFVKSKPKPPQRSDWNAPLSAAQGDMAAAGHPQFAAHQLGPESQGRPPGHGG